MKKNKRILLYAAIVAVIAAAIIVQQLVMNAEIGPDTAAPAAPARRGGSTAPVRVYVAEPSYISNGIRATGSLVPNDEVELTTEVAGKVTKIYFKEGRVVRKGELLLKINDEDLQAQLIRAEFQEKLLAEKLERQKILLTKDAISREAYDQLETDHNMAQADLQLLRVRIEKTEIRAPFDGVIGFRYVSEGSFVQPGTKVARLVDTHTLMVEFSIPEKYISLSLLDKPVVFRTEGFLNNFRARVYAVEPRLDEKTRTIALRARYDNARALLLPGMSADVSLITSETTNAIQVPSESIIPEMGGVSVWLVRSGRAVSTPVETGARNEQMVEITSGLQVGDSVVRSGILQLRPNMAVRVEE